MTASSTAPTYVLLDLNGNLHVGDEPTRDAPTALDRLAALQRRHPDRLGIAFCSNSSKEATSTLFLRLRKMGFSNASSLPEGSLFTSLDACKRLCDRLGRKRTLLLLNEDAQHAFPDYPNGDGQVNGSNLRWFKASAARPPSLMTSKEKELLQGCDSVLIGLAPSLMTYEWLDEAFHILSGEYSSIEQSPPLLIGTHRGMYYRPGAPKSPQTDPVDASSSVPVQAPLSLGPGAFITALEAAAALSADKVKIVGKPTREFFAECLRGLGWQQQSGDSTSDGKECPTVWIVGDDVKQDLSLPAATDDGNDPLRGLTIRRALVRTGKYRPGDEDKVADGPLDGVWGDFAQWVDAFERRWAEKDQVNQ
ncbi:unnamed protein product [Parajaminaea phylloscopi]